MFAFWSEWSVWAILWRVAVLEWVVWLIARQFLPGKPKVDISQDSTTSDDALFVHVPGLVGDPRTQNRRVMWQFQQYGRMAYVYYDDSDDKSALRFSTRAVVNAMCDAITQWHSEHPGAPIVFVPTSLGARLAYWTAARLRRVGIETEVILLDPPTGFKDLTLFQKLALICGFLVYNAPLLHFVLFIHPIINGLVGCPPDKQFDSFVLDDERRYRELQDTVKEARRWSPYFFVGQGLSLIPPLGRGNAAGWGPRSAYIIQSEHDTVVKQSAKLSWTARIGGGEVVPAKLVKGTYHAGSGLNPKAYLGPLDAAIRWVLFNE